MAMYKQSSDATASGNAVSAILGYYIKKYNLRNLFYKAFYGTPNANATAMNIFIDVNDIFKAVMKHHSTIDNNYEVACAIINMIAHYKSFIIDGNYGITPTFYLIWSGDHYGGDIEIRRNPEYCSKNRIIMFSNDNFGKRQIFFQNISVVRTICQYLPEVYFIDGTEDSSVMIYNLIKSLNNQNPNIVISKDICCNQITTLTNTLVFRPKKIIDRNEHCYVDNSYVVNAYTAVVASLNAIPQDSTVNDIVSQIPPMYWSVFIALNGSPKKSLQQIYDVRKTIKILKDNQLIIGTVPYHGVIDKMVFPESRNLNTELMVMNRNFDSVDLLYRQGIYGELPESKISLPAKLFDANGLKMINDTYFNSKGQFIDLIVLLK